MRVKDLIDQLNKMDPESLVGCFIEDQSPIIFEINHVDTAEGEVQREDDGKLTVKFTKSDRSSQFVLIDISAG